MFQPILAKYQGGKNILSFDPPLRPSGRVRRARQRLLREREAQQHRAERTMRTALERAEGNLTRASDDWDARIAEAIAAEHAFMIETVGQSLGEYGDGIIDHIEKKVAEEVGKLRAEVT
jgi:hypothetical protein